MAENLARSMEIPAYDTYPAPADPEELRMRSSHDELEENPKLTEAAGRIGSVVGRAVGMVKELPDNVKQRFDVIRGGAGEGRRLSERAGELAESARERIRETRQRTSRYAHDNPFQFLAVVAGAAFALGVVLRIWRSHRG